MAGALAVFAASQLSPQTLLYLTRHDVTTLTGRTEVMQFSFHRLMDSPLIGYGFGVEGQIFQNKYFPFWDDLWTTGPRIPIHNGYLSRAIGLGAPAAFLWLFLFLRPFAALFAGRDDPYGLKKPVVILLVLPVLILYLSETLGGDCRYPAGVVSTLVWAVAEKQRLRLGKADNAPADESEWQQQSPMKLIPAALPLTPSPVKSTGKGWEEGACPSAPNVFVQLEPDRNPHPTPRYTQRPSKNCFQLESPMHGMR